MDNPHGFRKEIILMRKIVKKLAALGVAAALAATAAISVSAARVENQKLIVRTNGGTIEMFSTESGGRLLFTASDYRGETGGGTSRCYIGLNGSCSSLYFSNDEVDQENLEIRGTAEESDIDIVRSIRLINNSVTGEKDLAELTLTLTNNSSETKSVGGKFFLDTMVEGNDSAPFRVAGVGAITYKTQFEGDSIPASFQAFDSLQNPKTIGTGTFAAGAGKPDVVQFRNWGDRRYPLVPELNTSEKIGDSAVNVIWRERSLAPGESLVCRTYYGLGIIDVSNESELKLGATKLDGSFTLNSDGTGYNPVRITSYVSNAGSVSLSDVNMYLDLPAGVTVNGGSSCAVGSLETGAESQNTWTLNAVLSSVKRTVTVTINAKSAQTGVVAPVSCIFTIPAIDGAEPIVEPDTTAPATTAPATTAPASTAASSARTSSAATDPTQATNVTDATSNTSAATTAAPTTAPASKDEATKSEATKSEASNGTVKTGEAFPAIAVLLTLVAGVGAIYFYRRKISAD